MSEYGRLPLTRRRSRSPHRPSRFSKYTPRRSTILSFLKLAIPTIILFLLVGLYLYEPHIEISFHNRHWVAQELLQVEPLSGQCFQHYNSTLSPKTTELHAGVSLRTGLDCYNYAATIPPPTEHRRTLYHSYWRADLAPFEERQEWLLKSFFATQHLPTSHLTLWSNGDLTQNAILQRYLRKYPDQFALRVISIPELAKGTALEGSARLVLEDTKAWVDGDLIRLLLLWNFGGVWVDMDSLLTRDLQPLLEHEFVTQWDCYDKKYQPFNGALMHFEKHSPYLCEAFYIMHTSAPPRSGSTDWGSTLYFKLYRRLLASHIPPFKVLPFCFWEGRSCTLDNRIPDPFVDDYKVRKGLWGGLEEGSKLDEVLTSGVFGVHLHNQWDKKFPKGGWVERLLLNRYQAKLGLFP